MRRLRVDDSKNIAEVGYDPRQKILGVVFVNAPSMVYTYYNVGMVKFVRLVSARSMGEYFERAIRSKRGLHPFTKARKG